MGLWNIDTVHTETGFSVKHMGLSNVRGSFRKTTGTVNTDADGNITAVRAIIDVASVDTRIYDRDKHLKGPDFFDVEKFPEIKFVSKNVVLKDQDTYEMEGELTIKETSKIVRFEAKVSDPIDDLYGRTRRGATLSFSINRRDYGLVWSQLLSNGDLALGNTVKISAEVEFVLSTEHEEAVLQ